MHKFRGRLLYKLDALRLTHFQAYHVCSSLIARKMESPKRSIVLQLASSCWFHFIFICFLHALYRLNSLVQQFANYAYALLSTICMHIFSLYNARVKLCDPFHSIHKGSWNLTLPCATNVFLFSVWCQRGRIWRTKDKHLVTSSNGPRKGGKWIMD